MSTSSQTDYYYFGARYYEPKIARWLSVDPAVQNYFDGKTGRGGIYNFFNLAFYNYAQNNPIKLVDPDGRVIVFVENFDQGDYEAFQAAMKYDSGFKSDMET